MDAKIADGPKAATDDPPPVHTTEVLAAAIGAAEQAKKDDAQQAKDSGDGVPAPTPGVGREGSGRLASLVPTLGRFATRAHQASAPYLSYAALASQEAARWVWWVCVYPAATQHRTLFFCFFQQSRR